MEKYTLDELKRQLPSYLKELGCELHFKGENGFKCRCPLHQDSNPSCFAALKDGVWLWKCHPCDKGGTVIDLHGALHNLSAADSIRELREKYETGASLPRAPMPPRKASPPPVPAVNRDDAQKAPPIHATVSREVSGSKKTLPINDVEKSPPRPRDGSESGVVYDATDVSSRQRKYREKHVFVKLPVPDCDFSNFPGNRRLRAGMQIIASLLWSGRNTKSKTMRLTKTMGKKFLTLRGKNPVTEVCKALGCRLVAAGTNRHGSVTNVWSFPKGASGSTTINVELTASQSARWESRHKILVDCQEKANPVTKIIRESLGMASEGHRFEELADCLAERGKIQSVKAWREAPTKITQTKDGDILTAAGRMPKEMRQSLLLGGKPVVELDIKSAHLVILAMFYAGETGSAWNQERERYITIAQSLEGFSAYYGAEKQHKKSFLASLNKSTARARETAPTYREFEKAFPLLSRKMNWIRKGRPKALGTRLRSALAAIMRDAVIENNAKGTPCIPVTDSLIVPADCDLNQIAKTIAIPMQKLTGITPTLCGSNGEIISTMEAQEPEPVTAQDRFEIEVSAGFIAWKYFTPLEKSQRLILARAATRF